MRLFWILALGAGCGGGKLTTADGSDDSGGSHTHEEGHEVPHPFDQGRYRADTFFLLSTTDEEGQTQGLDIDGDGEIDNALPGVLPAVVAVSGNDALSLDGLNGSISDALASDELIMLMEAVHEENELTLDILLGTLEAGDTLGIDPVSYGDDGTPQAHLSGAFDGDTDFEVQSGLIQIPIIFDPTAPPVLLPLATARIEGSLKAKKTDGILGGAIPINDLVSQVLEPLLPAEDEYDPDDYLGMERDQLLDYVRELGNESLADIELDDGTKAISAALVYEAKTTDW